MIRGTSRETCNYRSKETQYNVDGGDDDDDDDGDDRETIIYNDCIWQSSY